MTQWNQKANKCKICGERNNSILSGMAHLWVAHKINANRNINNFKYPDRNFIKLISANLNITFITPLGSSTFF